MLLMTFSAQTHNYLKTLHMFRTRSLSRGYSGRSVALTIHPYLSSRLKNA